MEKYNVLGVDISKTNIEDSISFFLSNIQNAKNKYICCVNVHTVITAYENNDYKEVLNNSFITLPDGGPIANEAKKKNIKGVSKVSGVDFFEGVLFATQSSNIRHFFYGNTKDNLEKLINKIKLNYPTIKICGYEPSLFKELTCEEIKELKKEIVRSQADIVWVALGAPKQEIFCSNTCKDTNACFVAVGGAFNVVAGITPRAPKWMRNHSLEWLFRLVKEPKRLFKRYLVTNTKYMFYRVKKG